MHDLSCCMKEIPKINVKAGKLNLFMDSLWHRRHPLNECSHGQKREKKKVRPLKYLKEIYHRT